MISLEVLSRAGQKDYKGLSPDVIAVLENGTLICFSGNLEQELWRWEAQPAEDTLYADQKAQSSRNIHVEHAMLTGWKDALSGLLAVEGSLVNTNSSKSPFVLVLVIKQAIDQKRHHRRIEVFSLEPDSIQSGDPNISASIRRIRVSELPVPSNINHEILDSQLTFLDIKTGTLQMCIHETLLTFDLSRTTPSIRSQLTLDNSDSVSIRPVSSALTMVASNFDLRLYDTTFGSVQAIFYLPELEYVNESQSIKKRKGSNMEDSKPVQSISLAASFSSISTIIGVRGDSLIGIRISNYSGAAGSPLEPPGKLNLIDSIGRGVKARKMHTQYEINEQLPSAFRKVITEVASSSESKWSAFVSELDRHAEFGNVEAFEKNFARRLGLHLDYNKQPHSRKQEKTRGLINGLQAHVKKPSKLEHLTNGITGDDSRNANEKDPQPEFSDAHHNQKSSLVWPEKRQSLRDQVPLAEYAIRKMFRWNLASQETPEKLSQHSSSIEIVFFPPNVFRWIMQSGVLSFSRILQIIRGLSFAHIDLAGHLSMSLVALDPEMQVLLQFLLSPMHLDAEELVHAISLLVDSLGYKDVPVSRVKHVLNSREENLPNGDFDLLLQNEAYAADMDLDLAFSTLESGTPVREHALTCALTRLHSFSSATIVEVLKKALSRSSIIDIIHLLRMQLASGGWLAMYNDTYQDHDVDTDQSMSDRGILVICTILSSALESIGMGVSAFENASIQDGEIMEDLVISLKAEISAALEGVQESTYLRCIVQQFLGYVMTLPKVDQALSRRTISKVKPVTLSSPGELSSILPLSLRVEGDVSRDRKHPGGPSTKRTQRDIGRLKSMQVPQYSRERIQF